MSIRAIRAIILAGIASLVIAGLARPAVASTHSTHSTPAQTAYSAFITWEHHPTASHLDRLVTASFKLPRKPDQADIDQLAADVNGGAKAVYVSDDEQYVYGDLTGGSGL